MLQGFEPFETHPAVVSKLAHAKSEYLRIGGDGAPAWVADPSFATAFESMKEATRMALRLPGGLRAFGMPLRAEQLDYEPEARSIH